MSFIINLVIGTAMTKYKKKQPVKEPFIIDWGDDEDERDLSWMIRDNQTLKKSLKKRDKKKK